MSGLEILRDGTVSKPCARKPCGRSNRGFPREGAALRSPSSILTQVNASERSAALQRPTFRLEQSAPNFLNHGALGATAGLYLLLAPGIAAGAIDSYILAPINFLFRPKLRADDLKLGRRLGKGGFGEVFEATLVSSSKPRKVIVKKAFEFGEAEVWMNERMQRACPKRVPGFIDAFQDPKNDALWLVWNFEGEGTLADAMRDRQFPRNLERNLFGKSLDDLDGPERQAEVIKSILAQTLAALRDMHATGIVHRDVKPENILMPSEGDGKLKFIDFGAAADLRIGINYLPFRTGGTRRQRSTSCPRPPRRRPPPPSPRCFHPSCGR